MIEREDYGLISQIIELYYVILNDKDVKWQQNLFKNAKDRRDESNKRPYGGNVSAAARLGCGEYGKRRINT